MSCNNDKPHLHIYSEDAATHDVADGFIHLFPGRKQRQIQVFTCSGYPNVKQKVEADAKLMLYPERMILCVIDFDGNLGRIDELKNLVASNIQNRVYVIGCVDEVETAKQTLGFQGHNDDFGKRLAGQNDWDWNNPCLLSSKQELKRLLFDLHSKGICPYYCEN